MTKPSEMVPVGNTELSGQVANELRDYIYNWVLNTKWHDTGAWVPAVKIMVAFKALEQASTIEAFRKALNS